MSFPRRRDSGLVDFDARAPADAQVVIVARPSIDGGSCATSADCEPGYFCAAWSDEYNASDNGVACLPFPADCTTCGCATDVTNAYTAPFHPGCYCFTAPGNVPNGDPNATPVVKIGCSVA